MDEKREETGLEFGVSSCRSQGHRRGGSLRGYLISE